MLKKDYTAKLLNLEDVIITKVENFLRKSGQKTVRTFLIQSKVAVELFTSFMV